MSRKSAPVHPRVQGLRFQEVKVEALKLLVKAQIDFKSKMELHCFVYVIAAMIGRVVFKLRQGASMIRFV